MTCRAEESQVKLKSFTVATTMIALLFALAVISQAQQESCTLGLDRAPAIRGLRLGMTVSEIRALNPALPKVATVELSAVINSIRAFEPDLPKEGDQSEYSAITYFAGLDEYDKDLKGVDKLVLLFFGGRLLHISVSYKEPNYWEEARQLSKPLGLPSKEGYARAECDGFTAILFSHPDKFTLYLTADTHGKSNNRALSTGSSLSARDIQTEVEKSAPRVAQIIQKAEDSFRKGKLNLEAGKRRDARDDFDQAVDEIHTSGIDVRASQELQTYYLDLVERIYRAEVPTIAPSKQGNVIELVAQNGQTPPTPPPVQQIGFVDQKFEPSPLDALQKLVLTSEAAPPRASRENPTLAGLRSEFMRAKIDYKVSLEKLLVSYERSVGKAELRFAESKKLYSEGRILKSQFEEASGALKVDRDKVIDTRRRIAAVGQEIAAAVAAERAKRPVAESTVIGPPPSQLASGQVPVVIRYLQEHLNDPYSMKLLKWSKVQRVQKYGTQYWYVSLRMRAKNGFGAYILKDTGFYIRHNKVVFSENL